MYYKNSCSPKFHVAHGWCTTKTGVPPMGMILHQSQLFLEVPRSKSLRLLNFWSRHHAFFHQQIGNLPQEGVKIEHIWNHHLDQPPSYNPRHPKSSKYLVSRCLEPLKAEPQEMFGGSLTPTIAICSCLGIDFPIRIPILAWTSISSRILLQKPTGQVSYK